MNTKRNFINILIDDQYYYDTNLELGERYDIVVERMIWQNYGETLLHRAATTPD